MTRKQRNPHVDKLILYVHRNLKRELKLLSVEQDQTLTRTVTDLLIAALGDRAPEMPGYVIGQTLTDEQRAARDRALQQD